VSEHIDDEQVEDDAGDGFDTGEDIEEASDLISRSQRP